MDPPDMVIGYSPGGDDCCAPGLLIVNDGRMSPDISPADVYSLPVKVSDGFVYFKLIIGCNCQCSGKNRGSQLRVVIKYNYRHQLPIL